MLVIIASTLTPAAFAVGEEHRVVAEAAGAGGSGREATVPHAFDGVLGRARAVRTRHDQRDRGDELRTAVRLGDVGELIQQQVEVGPGILAVPRPIRREHPGGAAQHVHADARVVGEGEGRSTVGAIGG